MSVQSALVFAFSFLFLHRLQFQSAFIDGYDGYFHIKYAYLLRTEGFISDFKWAAHSVWGSNFSDSKLLYHLLLVPFTYFEELATGIKWASVLLGAVAVTSFYLILKLNRFRYPFVWSLLLLGSGWYFLHRLNMCRPHLLSLSLVMWSVHLMLNGKRKTLALVTFLYALTYIGFHLTLILALIVSVHLWITTRRVEWKTPAAVLLAGALGMLVHPHFPDNLRLFWLQNFAVPWMSFGAHVDLAMATELDPQSTRDLLLGQLAVAIPWLGAVYLAVVRPRNLSDKTKSLLPISAALIVLTLLIGRFIEYSVPLTLIFLAAFYTDQLEGFSLRQAIRRGGRERLGAVAAAAGMAVLAVGLLARSYAEVAPRMRAPEPKLRQAALWLAEHTQRDELVFTCDWDDSPTLFYYNDRNRYPVFMDPAFMFFWDREHWEEWYRVAHGAFGGRTHEILSRDYIHGVCTADFENLRWIIDNDPRIEVVFETDGAYVFRVDPEPREISIDLFLKLNDGPNGAWIDVPR